ncbi:dynamin family protein [bacterium]|nr:dynamin family protein [bacterium]
MRNDFMKKFEAPVRNLEGKLAEFGSTLKVDREKLFAEPEYFVTIVGEFSAGKSSILNRLFFGEKDAIPTAVLPETCLINEIRYGDSQKAALVSGGVERDIDLSAISEVSKKELIEQKTGSMIKMECADDLLSDKVVFVDTPGVNSINDSHTDITFGYLPKSQFVLFVIDINNGGLSKSEIEFIKNKVFTVTQNNMFILLNKAESMPSSHCEKIRAQVIKDLANTGIKPERVCLVSGLKGNGIAELKATLKRELDAKRAEYYKNYTQGLIANFAELAAAELKMKLVNIGKDANAFAADKAAMEAEIKAVSAKYERLEASLNTKIKAVFEQYDSKIATDLSQIAQKLCAVVNATDLSDITGDNLSEGVQVALKKYVETDLQPAFYNDITKLLSEISVDAESLIGDFTTGISHDFWAPGKLLSGILFLLETCIYNLILPLGWITALIGQLLGRKLLLPLTGFMEKPVKSIICNNIQKAFDEEMIPAFIDNFNAKQNEVALTIIKGIEDAVNSQVSIIENSYSEKNIEALKAQDNAKAGIEAAIREAENLKVLAAN